MGRPERPVDPAAGPVQRLAHELRELRKAAGGPSYRTMAAAAGFSATTLSDAAAGRRLPSLPVVQGYVRACGGDPAEWEPRWKEADAEAAGAVRAEAADASPPYRGLARFEPADRELFFGRNRLLDELRELLCGNRLAVVFGASGSGKSSLLRAGLIPRLRETAVERGWSPVLRVLTPGARPADQYGHLLAPAEGEPESWVLVDQFEEVFTLCRDAGERDRFIDLLLTARKPESRLRVVIAVRADFYARCAEHRGLAEALSGAALLAGPMTADELRDAVVGPAQAVGLLVERELTARVVEEVLDQPGALPMLSHALLETWKRRRSRLLTLAAYEAAGGVRGAIAATAEEVYGRLSPAQSRTARQLLLRLIEPGQGTADTRRPLTRAELDEWEDPSVPVAVERLARERLVTVDEQGVELAHEALITCWPRLRRWIDEERERLRHHRHLTDATRLWLEHDRDPGALYRGARLARAEELFADDDEAFGEARGEGSGWGRDEGDGEVGGEARGEGGGWGRGEAGGEGRGEGGRWGRDEGDDEAFGETRGEIRGEARGEGGGWGRGEAGGEGRGEGGRWGRDEGDDEAFGETRGEVRGEGGGWGRGQAGGEGRDEGDGDAGGEGGGWGRGEARGENGGRARSEGGGEARGESGGRARSEGESAGQGDGREGGRRDSRGDGPGCVLTVPEREFLTAALDARAAERRAVTRATRRGRVLLSAFSALLAVALVGGLADWHLRRDTEQQRTDTAARRVADVADALRTTDPHTAMLLGVASWRVSPLPEARRALLGALAQPEHAIFTDPAPGDGPKRFLADSGRTLLSVEGRTWRTWDVTKARRTASGRLPAGDVVAAGPDARVLAVALDDGIRLWDRTTGRWTGDPRPLPFGSTLDLGADDRSYLSDRADDDRVLLRSVRDGRALFETRAAGLVDPAVSADGRLVAVCPAGRAPQLWDTGRHRTVPGSWERAHGLCGDEQRTALVFGGDRLVALSESGVRVWDTASGSQVAELDEPGAEDAAFSADGTFLATAGTEEIKVWRLSSPEAPVFRHPLNSQHLQSGLGWDPGLPILRYLEGGSVHCLDLGTAVTSPWRGRPLDAVQLSPDGRTLATAERSGDRYRVELRDTRDGHLLRTLPSPPAPVSRDPAEPVVPQDTTPLLAFSPDGTALTYGVSTPGREAAPQRFTVWDLVHDRRRTVLDLATPESAGAVVSVALGPGGRTLYAARTPAIGEVSDEAWNTGTGRRTTVLTGLTSVNLAVSPDGRRLVGDNRAARLPAGEVTGHGLVQGEQIGALAFAPDGSRLAAGDQTGRVALWDGALRHRSGVLRNVFPAPLGDTPEAVGALALSPDGHTLAVGGDAGTLQLWDTATRQPLGTPLTTPGENITTLAFSPDNGTLYAGSAHVPLQRYAIDPSRAVTRVCARARTDLTRAQWQTYVPEVPYRRVCGSARGA
ncbi:hypothetical protein [Streptomyces sp. NPDC050704]|uniref:nSTAND1 domain-containing NTPase n=1 Tax=Streptomyces sp. NPDC050704 TaxID=3157219 RepID=UPI003443E1C6